MANLTTISGRYGAIKAIATGTAGKYKSEYTNAVLPSITSWSLDRSIQNITYAASNTKGFKGSLKGIQSATGNINGIGAFPPVAPGERFKFSGFVGPSDGIEGNVGTIHTIAGVVNSVSISINYQLSNPITWQVGWTSDYQVSGDELKTTSGVFKDDSTVEYDSLLPSTEKNLYLDSRTGYCLQDANIQFNTDVSPYSNSCSVANGGWQSCVVGTTSCQISTNIHGHDYSGFVPGDESIVKIWIGQNSFWEFKKMMIGGLGGLNVDIASNSPVQFSCQMDFDAWPKGDSGYIRYSKDGGVNHTYWLNCDPSKYK